MLQVNRDKCTGCGACVQKCPQNCITWENKEFDFRYPIVNEEICINCGLCEKVCPIDKKRNNNEEQRAYAVVHKDDEIIKHSTSGGAFSAIAQFVLRKQGIVYGCSMDETFQVVHIRVDNEKDLEKLRGSKYVQSDVKNTYSLAEADLKQGLWVLYTGTPCQIVGLRSYLGREYETLITADIVCHGVGSQGYFDKFLDYARQRLGNIVELKFRSKKFVGWSCGGTIVTKNNNKDRSRPFYNHNNYYYHYFLKGDVYRQSCYSCQYANTVRVGDFTLGDFWGVERYNLGIDTTAGCSLLLVNNEKAQSVLKDMQEIELVEVAIEKAIRRNAQLMFPSKKSLMRDELIREYETLAAKEIHMNFIRKNKMVMIKGFIKSLIPYRVRMFLRANRK